MNFATITTTSISLATLLLLLSTIAPTITALSSDCQPPTSTRQYTGYSLKLGGACSQYVYCQNGIVTSTTTCPNGLLFNGVVGKGGICNWASSVICADSSTGGGAMDGAAGATPGPTPQPTQQPTPQPTRKPTPALAEFQFGSSQSSFPQQLSMGFCGVDFSDAKDTCHQPCTTSEDCCSPLEACFSTGSDCSTVNYSGSNHYYCGSSWCDAADSCGRACPSGADIECPIGEGCFADVPCAATGQQAQTQTTNAMTNVNTNSWNSIVANTNSNTNVVNDNPFNYYCGSTPDEAASLCIPCRDGTTVECGNDYTHGCFKGITKCAGNNNVNGNASGILNGQQTQSSQSQIQNQVPVSTPIPTLEPTIPPWTNAPFAPSPTSTSKTVIGYYASWQWYDRNKFADPQNVDFSKYDRINYAFFQPCPLGNLYGTDEWADPQLLWGPYIYDTNQQFMSGTNKNYFCSWDGPLLGDRNCNYHQIDKGLIYRAHNVGVEVMPSIGGWTLSDNFPGIAASAEKRENFAQQCVDLIDAYGFDGIDIDWEYPGYEDHSGTPADTINFTLLLQAVKSKLDLLGFLRGQSYGLTAALPCGPDKIEKIQVDKIKDLLTELNLMTYDMHGAWDVLTGTNAPMFDQGWTDKTKRWSVHGCVNNYVERGVPLSKMNIGLPFYGRSFRKATGMKQFHDGTDDTNFHLDEGSPQYFNIVNELGRMTTYRHEDTQTQYAVFDRDSSGGLVSYDDARAICDKVGYANERGMHGFIIWEISGDMIDMGNGRMATPLIDATNAKIQNPNYDCSTLRDPLWAMSDNTYRYAPPEPAYVDWSNYDAPVTSGGSGNDFNGAVVESRPPPTLTTPSYNTPSIYNSGSSSSGNSNNPGNKPSSDDCPLDYTGYYATAGCTSYVYCMNGVVNGGAQPCVPGTLFDVSINVCTWAANVQGCG